MKIFKFFLIMVLFLPDLGLVTVPLSAKLQTASLVDEMSEDIQAKTPTLKTGIEYIEIVNPEIELRLSYLPSRYSWIEKDLDGKVKAPKLGSTVIFENSTKIELKLSDGSSAYLPPGVKFKAKINKINKPGWFQKEGYLELEFTELAFDQKIDKVADGTMTASTQSKHDFMYYVSKVGKHAGYSAGGALAASYIAYKIVGTSAFADPYMAGGIAGAGAVSGLAYSIISKGKLKTLEPGSSLKLKLKNNWLIDRANEYYDLAEYLKLQEEYNKKHLKAGYIDPDFKVDISKFKKSHSVFGEECVSFIAKVHNSNYRKLGYMSFRLINSFGQDFYPLPQDFSYLQFNDEQDQSEFKLNYCLDYAKALYTFEVRDLDYHGLLYRQKLSL